MNRIFCLETEWNQSIHDIKESSSVKPLLDFFENCSGVKHVFRQVAGIMDFEWYIDHLKRPSYDNYDMVYLCFHGNPGMIDFPDGTYYTLGDFIRHCEGYLKGRNLHFGSCSTLKMDEGSCSELKRSTGARMVTGYTRKVDFVNSFLFELWLLCAIDKHGAMGPVQLTKLAEKEQPYLVKRLGFVAF